MLATTESTIAVERRIVHCKCQLLNRVFVVWYVRCTYWYARVSNFDNPMEKMRFREIRRLLSLPQSFDCCHSLKRSTWAHGTTVYAKEHKKKLWSKLSICEDSCTYTLFITFCSGLYASHMNISHFICNGFHTRWLSLCLFTIFMLNPTNVMGKMHRKILP